MAPVGAVCAIVIALRPLDAGVSPHHHRDLVGLEEGGEPFEAFARLGVALGRPGPILVPGRPEPPDPDLVGIRGAAAPDRVGELPEELGAHSDVCPPWPSGGRDVNRPGGGLFDLPQPIARVGDLRGRRSDLAEHLLGRLPVPVAHVQDVVHSRVQAASQRAVEPGEVEGECLPGDLPDRIGDPILRELPEELPHQPMAGPCDVGVVHIPAQPCPDTDCDLIFDVLGHVSSSFFS